MNTQQSFSKIEQLKLSISANNKQLSNLNEQLRHLQSKNREEKNKLNGYPVNEQYKIKIEESNRNLGCITNEINEITAKIAALIQTNETHNATLATFDVQVSTDELIEQQNNVKAIKKRAADLEALIAEQQRLIEQASHNSDTTALLKKQRGKLLAESAAGIDNTKKLGDIDAAIAKAEQSDHAENQAKAAAASKAHETIEGLQDMLSTLQPEISKTQRTLTLMQDAWLGSMAAEEFNKYRGAAQTIADSLKAISAIDSVIRKFGVRRDSGMMPATPSLLVLPALGDMPMDHGVYFRFATDNLPPSNDVEDFLVNLKALGIEIE